MGDGAYTGGMIHEALNNCRKNLNLIIIINENEMSISKNIGRFATHLSKLRAKSGYFKTKKATGAFLRKIPLIGKGLFRFVLGVKKSLKNVLYGSNYFESMGLTYLGPIDGNDEEAVERLLREAKKLDESVVVHVKTKKGKGFAPAEDAPDIYHGMQPTTAQPSTSPSFSSEMGRLLTEAAAQDGTVCAVTAAMCDGTGLCEFKKRFPERFFDVGIAEEHALTFSAGLAANGMKPYAAIYSTFLQRGYDNLIHDIALQKLPCVICVDRAGLNAGDGATHHGIFDVAFLSQIPNFTIYTPITLEALKEAMNEAYQSDAPSAIRYPNGTESSDIVQRFYSDGIYTAPGVKRDYGTDDIKDIVIVTHGRIVSEAMKASEKLQGLGIRVGIVLLEKIKPYSEISEKILALLPSESCGVVFLEEGIRSGGMGTNLADRFTIHHGISSRQIRIIAIDDSFVEKRIAEESVYRAAGLDEAHICSVCEELYASIYKAPANFT